MVMFLHSWLPLSKNILSGYFTFKQKSNVMVSTELYPRSTKSPIMMNLLSGMLPPILNISLTSQNWPWTSPAILTGPSMAMMLDSSMRMFLTRLQSFLTADSGMGLHSWTCQSHLSTSAMINNVMYIDGVIFELSQIIKAIMTQGSGLIQIINVKQIKIMSSFPEIYSRSQSMELRPQKQGGIFSIKLLLNSPLHPKSPHSKNKLNLSLNLDNIRQNSKGLQALQKHNKILLKRSSARYSHGAVSFDQKKGENMEEVGSMMSIFKDSTDKLMIMGKMLKDDTKTMGQIRKDMKKMNDKIDERLKQIREVWGGRISDLYGKLCMMRRQTGMETKVNKKQANNLREEMELAKCVVVEMGQSSQEVSKQCSI